MRIRPFLMTALLTLALIVILNKPWGSKIPMALGGFLSPQTGFWQNAEPVDYNFGADLNLPQLKGKTTVYIDERLVPHVFADNDTDLYFAQGYLHAKFRLFQMDLQTKAAEGRASEIAGPKAINYDKEQRRLGMKFAAENTLAAVEQNPKHLAFYDAYTAGINAYINTLTVSSLPLEYKLLNLQPEAWTNLRTMLLLKMMAKMLASGNESDLAFTNLKNVFTNEQINAIYPQVPDSLLPIVPKGEAFASPGIKPVKPAGADTSYFKTAPSPYITARELYPPDRDNGSNNWVVAGNKTASGKPILCNDPHLELSLPSIWYEIQLNSPTCNVYGASLPGSPFVIIGFNDSIAWGVTNTQRDVKDYFTIQYKDASRKEYWYDSAWKPTQQRVEEIKVKGGPSVFDTVSYTVFGPVMYDAAFPDTITHAPALALKWAAHHTGDDGGAFFDLNRARNYNEYVDAIKAFECPGQNFVFASKSGDIALWQQGKFPARWEGQGMYLMEGQDAAYDWQGFIPQAENPHALNPARGFLESANQRPADASYPYFIPGKYITPRGRAIEKYLGSMNGISIQNMMDLQSNYYNILAADMRPLLVRYTDVAKLNAEAKKYLDVFQQWNLDAGPASTGQTIYQCWMDSLQKNIWLDELTMAHVTPGYPDEETTMEMLVKDSSLQGFVDNKTTPVIETIHDQVTDALNKVALMLALKEKKGQLEWAKYKDVTIYHLLKESLLPFARPHLNMGGWGNVINAVKKSHGPSWRMIVQLSTPTEAYGVFPGGQSGNPGSRFYDNNVDVWASGKYNILWMMRRNEEKDGRAKWVMRFDKLTGTSE